MKLSEKLKELRENQNLSLMKLAKILNVSDASIFNWENGVEPKASNICALADYFQISADELLCRVPADPTPSNSIKITPLSRRLLEAFDKMSEEDQRKFVGMAEALAVLS